MDACIVGHKRGSREWPGFRSLCFGSFQQQLGAHKPRDWCLALVRPKYPALVSVIFTPTAEQMVSLLAMHWRGIFRPGLRQGRTSSGQRHPAPGCLSCQHF